VQIGQVNLGLQIGILALIWIAYFIRKRRKYFIHGTLMLVGIILNVISFLLVMGPSLLSFDIIRTQPLHEYSLITLTHSAIGSIALILGVIVVASWHLQSSTKNCVKMKKVMKPTIILWTIALVLGIALYIILYGL
jgi:uncharacterized membrane protein YozB (DUF420 family)